MSKSNIRETDKLILMGRAGGMCEFPGCGALLYEDPLTKQKLNWTNLAHIIGDSSEGPRGEKDASEKYGKDINNIILLCPTCHKRIDTKEGEKKYPVKVLRQMKDEHERRIRKIMSAPPINESTVLIYTAKIDGDSPVISDDTANNTIMPRNFPDNRYPTRIEMKHAGKVERNEEYWKEELDNLKFEFEQSIKRRIDNKQTSHLSVFALAPQPLLVKLGRYIAEFVPTSIYQLHREPKTWNWIDDNSEIIKINEPTDKTKKPILVFGLSSNIRPRVESHYKADEASIWEVTIKNPNNDYLKSEAQLKEFRQKVRHVMEDINHNAASGNISVYMAMSNACAIEFGRIRMPKADRHLDLYDYYDGKDNHVLTI